MAGKWPGWAHALMHASMSVTSNTNFALRSGLHGLQYMQRCHWHETHTFQDSTSLTTSSLSLGLHEVNPSGGGHAQPCSPPHHATRQNNYAAQEAHRSWSGPQQHSVQGHVPHQAAHRRHTTASNTVTIQGPCHPCMQPYGQSPQSQPHPYTHSPHLPHRTSSFDHIMRAASSTTTTAPPLSRALSSKSAALHTHPTAGPQKLPGTSQSQGTQTVWAAGMEQDVYVSGMFRDEAHHDHRSHYDPHDRHGDHECDSPSIQGYGGSHEPDDEAPGPMGRGTGRCEARWDASEVGDAHHHHHHHHVGLGHLTDSESAETASETQAQSSGHEPDESQPSWEKALEAWDADAYEDKHVGHEQRTWACSNGDFREVYAGIMGEPMPRSFHSMLRGVERKWGASTAHANRAVHLDMCTTNLRELVRHVSPSVAHCVVSSCHRLVSSKKRNVGEALTRLESLGRVLLAYGIRDESGRKMKKNKVLEADPNLSPELHLAFSFLCKSSHMLYVNPQSLAHEGILLEKQRLALDLTEDELRLSISKDPQLLTYSPAVLEARRLELAAALASMGLPCDWLALNSTYSGGPYGSYAVPRYTCRRSLEPLAAATAQSVSVSGERPVFAQTANASYDDVAWGGQGGEGGDSDDDGDVAGGLAGAGGQPSLPVPPLVMLPPVDEEAARKLARDVIAQRPSIVKRTDLVTRLASLEAAAKVVPGWAQQLARLAPHQLGNILWARSPVMARVRFLLEAYTPTQLSQLTLYSAIVTHTPTFIKYFPAYAATLSQPPRPSKMCSVCGLGVVSHKRNKLMRCSHRGCHVRTHKVCAGLGARTRAPTDWKCEQHREEVRIDL